MNVPKSRVTFNCPIDLRKEITELAMKEGISRGQKIVELLEAGLQADRTGVILASDRILDKRVTALEQWKKEQEINIHNLESTIAEILNQNVESTKISRIKHKKSIPKP